MNNLFRVSRVKNIQRLLPNSTRSISSLNFNYSVRSIKAQASSEQAYPSHQSYQSSGCIKNLQKGSNRFYSDRETKSHASVSEAMEAIQDAYDAATDEFQIASEETEENTVYASDDREAARKEFQKLTDLYDQYMTGESLSADAKEEITQRVGNRIRELENALTALEEKAQEHD